MTSPAVRAKNQPLDRLANLKKGGLNVGGISERHKEIKRRRHRRKKLSHYAKKLKKATVSEKAMIAEKLRNMTPGCEVIIENWQLTNQDR